MMLQYQALWNALPPAWRDPDSIGAINPEEPTFCNLMLSTLTAKEVRCKLLDQRKKSPCCIAFWERKYPDLNMNDELFLSPFRATTEVRLRTLQWKIIHNIYPTKILLHKMKLSDTSDCAYCTETDFIVLL